MKKMTLRNKQSGAALVVGLIMLLVLTVLGISGMNSTIVERRMANNTQVAQNAFQSAETGVDRALTAPAFNTGADVIVPIVEINPGSGNFVATTTQFVTSSPAPEGFSVGEDEASFLAWHFVVQSTGTSASNAVSLHRQNFFVVGPGGIGL